MGQEIIKITSGTYHVCALLKDTTVKCFGHNSSGQLGNGSTTNSYDVPVDVKVSVSDVSPISGIWDINAGCYSTCLMVNKVPKCFGRNTAFQLGIANGGANVLYADTPTVNLPNDKEAVSVHVGCNTGHIVYSDNTVFSFGNNFEGTLGDGSTISGTNIIGGQDGENAVQMLFSFPSTSISAISGDYIESSGYGIHIFTSSGTFTVNSGTRDVEFIIIGGGGSGGIATSDCGGGGGGAGGYISSVVGELSGGGCSPVDKVTVTSGSYPIVVGAGGAAVVGHDIAGLNGGDSSAFGHTAIGGGGGSNRHTSPGKPKRKEEIIRSLECSSVVNNQ
ncbi:hypothetical protein CTEN210_11664 [Chaetoceros tenuissimus]|uniref:Glycine-rich domain-containing protein n=1 Tax=Chaetoceros tenuissimus TaxID=426638 RepID=A0AAD3H9R5_9STRA|nr:hypothetical protein CTEN210_11664 [Chaetoceros tenuissimus]